MLEAVEFYVVLKSLHARMERMTGVKISLPSGPDWLTPSYILGFLKLFDETLAYLEEKRDAGAGGQGVPEPGADSGDDGVRPVG